MRMKAAVLPGVGQPFSVEEVELDPPRAGELLVKMVATGVCHSDVHVYSGDTVNRPFPIVLGHEGAGIVEAVGEGVTDLAPGDHVVLTFLPSCGRCRWCHIGQPTMCDLGAHIRTGKMLDGTSRLHRIHGEGIEGGSDMSNFLFVSTWAEYSVVPQASAVKVPKDIPLERICLLGCGFTTGFGAATSAVHIRPGETATIIGCGGLGLSAVQGAALSGAGKIIAVDLHDEKLALAKKFGATHTIRNNHDPAAVVAEIMDITWGVGTDFTFEFVGYDRTHETWHIAFYGVRKGGTMVVCGVGAQDVQEVPIEPRELVNYRRTMQGVLFGDAQFRTDIPRFVELYREGRLHLDELITHEMRLEDINTAVENVLAENRVGRQVIRFD